MNTSQKPIQSPSDGDLWKWFGLSYASWLTIPRVLLHEMPLDWQNKMTKLLEEYDDVFSNTPSLDTFVNLKKDGKFVKMPDWIDYRHPRQDLIEPMKK